MRTAAMMIQVVPGDIVYVVISPRTMVVMKAKVTKVEMEEHLISYYTGEGKIVCEKGSNEFKKGQRVIFPHAFTNANLDTGVGLGSGRALFVFSDKEKCKDFLREYNSHWS